MSVDVKEETNDGIKWKVFTPKKGVKITSFTEGRVEIAKTSTRLKCLKIPLDSQTPLVYVVHGGCGGNLKCFEKVGGQWKEIGYSEFDRKVDAIKKNVVRPNEEVVRVGSTFGNLKGSKEPSQESPTPTTSTAVPPSDEFSEAQMVKQGGTTLDLENTQSPENLFEKASAAGYWQKLTQGDFLKKLSGMRKSGSSSPNPSSDSTTPS
ncbi:hypothetical protein BEWA_005890 [Theileria equi strain WA]|uniref:Uncharacterized protein n=1 Tax=Theileria equi strain WA TaxID=1537102 RepID=L0B1Q2_THEEQ|nr:hypothetical protein BEWA_005890 [Theileria equi strain WA]AFZ81181.1 hypothetical protein BEWA_005890 [Theileria equi strain WA]|eukprot:XP_004830847.1 hypothetical protein BEWA_005890 [Theileria equi strain WA]